MRRKKHKNTRRAVRFYKIQHGFREPFKILLDGNFVHALLQSKMKAPEELLPKLLGGAVKLYVTPCVQSELRALGAEYKDALSLCKGQALHKCGHESAVAAADCLLAQIGESNPEHFIIATQDRQLRHAVMRVPGGACVNAAPDGLHLAQPAELREKLAAQAEGVVDASEAAALKPLAAAGKRERRDGAAAARRVNDSRYRTRKAQGPNPLSCRPKKRKQQQEAAAARGGGERSGGDGGGGKRKRPRRAKAAGAGTKTE